MSGKMLKWLKQKPTTEKGQGEMSADKITDDPLATIQVHPPNANKKSKSKSNEIYAVSRVNPLFEEDGKGLLFSPGNHSGSSGYDSGQSDEDGRGSSSGPEGNTVTEVIVSSEARGGGRQGNANHIVANTKGGPQLFRDTEDYVIHHEAALVGPDGRPVLQIVQQNNNYVRSIAVAVPRRRPLSPIHEGGRKEGGPGGPFRVNAIQVPSRRAQGDVTGAGRVLQKDTRYVQSIRIGPSGSSRAQPGRFSTAATAAGESDPRRALGLGRKPSVTFSERVDILVEGNLKVPRRLSADLDSIVTDSLLILTSKEQPFEHMHNWNAGWNGKPRVSLVTDFHNRRYARSISSDSKSQGGGNSSSSENELGDDHTKINGDLQAFASSLKKSRPIKQIVSGAGAGSRSFTPSPLLEPHSGVKSGRAKGSGASSENEDHDNDERSSESSGSQQDLVGGSRPRTPRNGPNGRSPFGGIADHYAAAKEIAKEIESYSVGTTKSTKRSLVRDMLLSSRGRSGGGSSSSSSTSNSVNNSSQDLTGGVGGGPPGGDGYFVMINKGRRILDEVVVVEEGRSKNGSSAKGSGNRRGGAAEERSSWGEGRREMLTRGEEDQVYVKASGSASAFKFYASPQERRGGEGQDHIQSASQQVPIYDALPRATHHDDSDSGNSSTDRSTGEVRLEIGDIEDGERRLVLTGAGVGGPGIGGDGKSYSASPPPGAHPSSAQSSRAASVVSSESGLGSNGSGGGKGSGGNHSKVMLVSGDSQNMVVDLSAVPADLRDAILAGTALITLPDGVKKRLEPGYTVVAIPSSVSSSSSELNRLENEITKVSDGTSGRGGGSGGEGSPLAADKFGAKNKAQIWDVLQHQEISATLTSVNEKGKGFRGKDKKITTVLPFHPNHDSNTSPDFTIEGHRLKLQMKRLQNGKKRRCWCRLFGMLFFLLTFLGILVALSLIYTRGQRYFGSV